MGSEVTGSTYCPCYTTINLGGHRSPLIVWGRHANVKGYVMSVIQMVLLYQTSVVNPNTVLTVKRFVSGEAVFDSVLNNRRGVLVVVVCNVRSLFCCSEFCWQTGLEGSLGQAALSKEGP